METAAIGVCVSSVTNLFGERQGCVCDREREGIER